MLVLTLATALAALPPGAREAKRDGAEHHVVIEVASVDAPADGLRCRFAGTVAEVYRGELDVGQSVDLTIACRDHDDDMPVGPTVFTDKAKLADATYIVAYLSGSGESLGIVSDWAHLVDRLPTAIDRCVEGTAEAKAMLGRLTKAEVACLDTARMAGDEQASRLLITWAESNGSWPQYAEFTEHHVLYFDPGNAEFACKLALTFAKRLDAPEDAVRWAVVCLENANSLEERYRVVRTKHMCELLAELDHHAPESCVE